MSEPESLTPAQQEIRGQIDAIRGDTTHPANQPGHRLHEQEHEKFLGLYRQLHGESASAAAEAPADDASPAPRPTGSDEPHATPQTAAELAAMPAPGFPPAAEQAGWRWDEAKLPALYAAAEAEGLVPLVRAGMHVVTRLASESVDVDAEAHAVIQAWGSRFASKMDAVDRFEALLRKTQPEFLAALERTGKTEHRLWLEYAATAGEQMMDASTPQGEARLRAKYQRAEPR